jgi:hypothetical protein
MANFRDSNDDKKKKNDKLLLYSMLLAALIIITAISFFFIGGKGISGCKSIIVPQSKYNCISNLALSTRNASMCANLPIGYQGSCYQSIAMQDGNYSICYSALNTSYVNGSSCFSYFANFTKNASLCNVIHEPARSQCIMNIAVEQHNKAVCAAINNYTLESICNSSADLYNAFSISNTSYCSTLKGNETPAYANAEISVLEKYNTTYFNNQYSELILSVENKSTYTQADFCYALMAINKNNSNYCNYIKNLTIYAICESSSAAYISNTSTANYTNLFDMCNKESGQNYTICKSAIIISDAIQNQNASMCRKLQGNLEISCYQELAKVYLNSTYCTDILSINSANASSAMDSCLIGMESNSSS